MTGDEISLFGGVMDLVKNADAIVFLTLFIYLQYKGKIRWGEDCDADKRDLVEDKKSLQGIVDHYHNGLEQKLQRYEEEARGGNRRDVRPS